MSLDIETSVKPHERLAAYLQDDLVAVDQLIRTRMASEHAPRIPEVTAHLVDAGGKRVRPMLTLAGAGWSPPTDVGQSPCCAMESPYEEAPLPSTPAADYAAERSSSLYFSF